ncbi:MAG: hypothetical protein V3U15_04840 [Nitrospinota bacterium]
MKNTCGVNFTDLGKTEEGFLNSLYESLNKSEKMSEEDVDGLIMGIDTYLEQFRKSL